MSKKQECRVRIHVWLLRGFARYRSLGYWELWWILGWMLNLKGCFAARQRNVAKIAGGDWNLFCLPLNWNSPTAAKCLLGWAGGSVCLFVCCPHEMDILPFCKGKCVPHLGQWCSGTRALRGHSEHCGDPQANTSRCSIHIDPEGNPGQNDNKEAGNVHLNQVIAHLPLQVETSFYTGELAWEGWEIHGILLIKHGEPPVFHYCLGTFLALPRTGILLKEEINSCCPVLNYECTTSS